jgi:hypothetical protein
MPIGSYAVFQPIGEIFDNPPILSHIYANSATLGFIVYCRFTKNQIKTAGTPYSTLGRTAFGLRATT